MAMLSLMIETRLEEALSASVNARPATILPPLTLKYSGEMPS